MKRIVRKFLNRPALIPSLIRGRLLFLLTHFLKPFFVSKNIHLGKNVRMQKLRCVSAELPLAVIRIQDNTILYENARLEAYGSGKISIGPASILGDTRIYSKAAVSIGARFLSSWNVFIQDYNAHPLSLSLRAQQVSHMVQNFVPRFGQTLEGLIEITTNTQNEEEPTPIVIGDDVWCGANVTILKGAQIGNGVVIATGSVVMAGEYPPHCVLAGNPAKIVRVLS